MDVQRAWSWSLSTSSLCWKPETIRGLGSYWSILIRPGMKTKSYNFTSVRISLLKMIFNEELVHPKRRRTQWTHSACSWSDWGWHPILPAAYRWEPPVILAPSTSLSFNFIPQVFYVWVFLRSSENGIWKVIWISWFSRISYIMLAVWALSCWSLEPMQLEALNQC